MAKKKIASSSEDRNEKLENNLDKMFPGTLPDIVASDIEPVDLKGTLLKTELQSKLDKNKELIPMNQPIEGKEYRFLRRFFREGQAEYFVMNYPGAEHIYFQTYSDNSGLYYDIKTEIVR